MNPPSIVIVLPDGIHAKGGIQRMMLYLTRELDLIKPRPFCISTQRTRIPYNPVVRHISTLYLLTEFCIKLIVRKTKIVHINVAPRGSTWRKILFANAAKHFKASVLLHLHGSAYDSFYRASTERRRLKIKEFFQNADKVVVLGEYWRIFVVDELGVSPHNVRIIGNGVPSSDIVVSTRETPTIGFMGVVGKRKGVDVLILALAELKGRGIAFRAKIGGNGEISYFKASAAKLGLLQLVDFLGWVDEEQLNLELQSCDIFTLPSRAENQPVSILEAMAKGLPIVASNVGAIPEQVVHGVTGLLVPPENHLALADALEKLIRSQELRVQMGEAGKARWKRHYSLEVAAEKFAKLYSEILTPN